MADNVRYGPNLQGKTLIDSEVEGYLEQADLDASFVHKPVVGLSVGQAQRVALARTLANKPDVSKIHMYRLSWSSAFQVTLLVLTRK